MSLVNNLCFNKLVVLSGGDPFQYVIPAKWSNDMSKVVLEIQSETSKQCTDSSPCSLRDLIRELEEEGIVDVKLHGHSCERPSDVDSSSGLLVWGFSSSPTGPIITKPHLSEMFYSDCIKLVVHFVCLVGQDFFCIKPSSTTSAGMFAYTPGMDNLKFTSLASFFPKEVGTRECLYHSSLSLLPTHFQVMDLSPMLARYWRVAYIKADKATESMLRLSLKRIIQTNRSDDPSRLQELKPSGSTACGNDWQVKETNTRDQSKLLDSKL